MADGYLNCVASEGKLQEELEAEEQEEEEEAKSIQKRLAANLSEEDYDLSFFEVLCFFLGIFLCISLECLQLIPRLMVNLFFFGCCCRNAAICWGGKR